MPAPAWSFAERGVGRDIGQRQMRGCSLQSGMRAQVRAASATGQRTARQRRRPRSGACAPSRPAVRVRAKRGAEMTDRQTQSQRGQIGEALGHDRSGREEQVGRGEKEDDPDERGQGDRDGASPSPGSRRDEPGDESDPGEDAGIGERARDRDGVERVVRHEVSRRQAEPEVLELDPQGGQHARPRARRRGGVVERDRVFRGLVDAQRHSARSASIPASATA